MLPAAEWGRLAGTEVEPLLPSLDKDTSAIVVVEDGDRVVAHHVLLWVLHAESLWVHPDYRRSRVGALLWRTVRGTVKVLGAKGFLTAALNDDVRRLIRHVGGTLLPGTHHVVPVKGE